MSSMASRSLNQATIIGNVTRDGEVKFTPSGTAKLQFSVATSHRYKKGDEWVDDVCYHNIVHWGGDKIANYITKGKQVAVTGRISNRSYDGNDGTKKYISEIVAEQVLLLGGGDKQERTEEPPVRSMPRSAARGGGASSANDGWNQQNTITDDDIPWVRVAPMDGRFA